MSIPTNREIALAERFMAGLLASHPLPEVDVEWELRVRELAHQSFDAARIWLEVGLETVNEARREAFGGKCSDLASLP